MKKLKTQEDTRKYVGKVIAFWNQGRDTKEKPYYYDWILSITNDIVYMKYWDEKKGKWVYSRSRCRVDCFVFEGNDWYGMTLKEAERRILASKL